MLKRLLKVKERRVEVAAKKSATARLDLEHREDSLKKKEHDLDETLERNKSKVRELFGEVKGQAIGLRDLELMKAKFAEMRELERHKRLAIHDAKSDVEKAEEELAEAKLKLHKAHRNSEKTLELINLQTEEDRRAKEVKNEKELEDFVSIRRKHESS